MTVLIAGAGIGGLTLALTCHQIGVPVKVLEAVRELRPLGVGINLQPNAVRELLALGLGDALDRVGVQTREYGLYAENGTEIWTEPRGRDAGYAWPQYSVHRGALQMALYDAVVARLGPEAVLTDARVEAFETRGETAVAHLAGREETGAVLIGADGLHSRIRAQMFPEEGAPNWAGYILWRGATRGPAFGTGASMALIGHYSRKFVTYPISPPDPETGLSLMNWLAEIRVDPAGGWNREDWSRPGRKEDFADAFAGFRFDWFDAPALIAATEAVFEYPMVDRDPLPRWTEGRVTLMGDAAHVMYPTGSNGASQAIVDARKIGRAFLDHGVGPGALAAYEAEVRPAMAKTILANRGAGPDYMLEVVQERTGGVFDDIEAVLPHAERARMAADYKATAGFAIETLNASPPIIPEGARIAG